MVQFVSENPIINWKSALGSKFMGSVFIGDPQVIHVALALTLLPAAAQYERDGTKKALAQATQIISTRILPRYKTAAGFGVKPLAINYQDDPAIDKILDQYGSLWKQIDPFVADAYTAYQRKANARTDPEAGKYQALIIDAFHQAMDLRGGGSASGQLYTFAEAQTEWIICQFGVEGVPFVTDQEFTTRLTKALDVNGTPEPGSVRAILAKLKAAERALTKSDAAILRAE